MHHMLNLVEMQLKVLSISVLHLVFHHKSEITLAEYRKKGAVCLAKFVLIGGETRLWQELSGLCLLTGCERAQSKAGSAGILQHLVALLTPCNQVGSD